RRRLCRTGIGLRRCRLQVLIWPWVLSVSVVIARSRRVGKATGSRECAPDDKLRVPTIVSSRNMVGTAQARLCPPYEIRNRLRLRHFIMLRIVRIARDVAAIKRLAVIRRQRKTLLQTARQVRVGDEDAAEGDGVGVAVR